MNSAPYVISGLGELTPEEQGRAIKANELFQKKCEENGVRVANWMDFSAWKSYVNGDLAEPELKEKAKKELEDIAKKFGKYLVIKEEEPSSIKKFPIELERARLANKIYKKICAEMGITLCFFSDFAAWSDYVKGKISEAEFSEKARAEAEKMGKGAEAA